MQDGHSFCSSDLPEKGLQLEAKSYEDTGLCDPGRGTMAHSERTSLRRGRWSSWLCGLAHCSSALISRCTPTALRKKAHWKWERWHLLSFRQQLEFLVSVRVKATSGGKRSGIRWRRRMGPFQTTAVDANSLRAEKHAHVKEVPRSPPEKSMWAGERCRVPAVTTPCATPPGRPGLVRGAGAGRQNPRPGHSALRRLFAPRAAPRQLRLIAELFDNRLNAPAVSPHCLFSFLIQIVFIYF